MTDHLPLHRQEAILARHGWDVRRSTLCNHLRKCGELLTPLYDLMRHRLLQSFAIHADDLPAKMPEKLNEMQVRFYADRPELWGRRFIGKPGE